DASCVLVSRWTLSPRKLTVPTLPIWPVNSGCRTLASRGRRSRAYWPRASSSSLEESAVAYSPTAVLVRSRSVPLLETALTVVAGVLEFLRLDGAEIDQPCPRGRAADRAAKLLLRRRGGLAEGVLVREVAMPVHIEGRPVGHVAARLGDGVDEAAGGPAELGG